ncbi:MULTISPECIES: Crp/Fnr family transcriptional regulator [unclassified Paludibacterium]|uniref:Crp/Fnr family transcriptional regulator n=1 Tax=unclassified Paludibacterium TaxID=2618429 RepID=UPI001C044F38|nr:Crp/Fnr family transcriptional regulator [Paludibacterium sp. B53371]BEV73020.1 Crp/Fnr family transcriptional regulator [Paludibacterium sp. THUN1379]
MARNIDQVISVIEQEKGIYQLLKGCPYEVLKEFVVVRSRKGEFLLNQGQVYDSLYIVVSGLVRIYVMTENGRKYTLAIYQQGNYIGEHEIFDQRPYSCFVEAISDVVLLRLRREPFLRWLNLDRHLSESFTRSLCNQIYMLSEKAGADTLYPLRQRICQFLLAAAARADRVNLDREELAELMGVATRSINRILKSLREEGLIAIEGHQVIFRDVSALQHESEKKTYDFYERK